MDSHRHHPLRFQLRATLYTEYASNSKDHIDEPDSQGVQLASVLSTFHSNRHLKTGARSYRTSLKGVLESESSFWCKTRPGDTFEIVFINFEFFLANGAGSWRLTAQNP